MRSDGHVRFIKISSRAQIVAASVVAFLLLAWLVTMATLSVMQFSANRERIALNSREAKVATAEQRVSQYRDGLHTVTADLVRRQDFIQQMVEAYIGKLPDDVANDPQADAQSRETEKMVRKVSAVIPEAAQIAQFESRQLAFVARLTRHADERAERAAQAIRKLGLNPNAMLASASGKSERGGPYFSLATSQDGSLDPRFQQLGVSLARMEALERSLEAIPQVQPASMDYISSGFGYRSDPFNGHAAFHAGLDFRGPVGTPIHAAAKGRVSFAGRKSGYGNVVEVDHGNGLMTRYAHMSRIGAQVGQKVDAGAVIGAIGNTGRSTGPHLHFEVRVHDRAVNPRPFLKASLNVQQQETDTGA